MFKNKSALKIQKEVREYEIICDTDSPLTEVIEVLKEAACNVQRLLDECLEQAKKNQESNEFQKVEEVKEQNG